MLIQFIVKNYLSIRDEAILSMEPSSDNTHPENIINKHGSNALNTIAIYGANASGKTNLFKAMTIALNLIRNSEKIQVTDPIPVIPFKFNKVSGSLPTAFEFTFVAKNNKKYVYGFSATQKKIIEEYLYVYNTSKPSLIFDRKNTSDYKFPRGTKKEMELIATRNTDNKLLLSTATSWNVKETKPAYEWLATGIDTFTNIIDMQGISLEMYRTEENGTYTHFAEELLKKADINISSINVKANEVSPEQLNKNPFGILFNFSPSQHHYNFEITTGHIVTDDYGNKSEYVLQLPEESLGTQQLFAFAPILKQAFDNGKVIVIDEIDKSLHPFIVKYLINMFRDSSINTDGAQLIATTHETALLSQSVLRKDQIYFTEKNNETGVTELYSLDDFSVRKTDNIEKGYLLGRYGAIPYPYTEDIIL